MSTALDSGHIVSEGNDGLVIAVVILHSDFCYRAALFALHIDDLGMNGSAALLTVEILNEGYDTALVVKHLLALTALTLIGENYLNACVKEGLLSHSGEQNLKVEYSFLKDSRIGLESDVHAVSVGVPLALEGTCNRTALESLAVLLAVTAVLNLKPLGESVNNRRTNAVKTAGDLISLAAELTARVKNGVYYLKGGKTELLIHTRGNTTSVVLNGNTVILVNSYVNAAAIACKCLVDRVIHYLVNEVMKTAYRGSSDIHTGSFSYSLKSLKNLYLAVVIALCFHLVCHLFLLLF